MTQQATQASKQSTAATTSENPTVSYRTCECGYVFYDSDDDVFEYESTRPTLPKVKKVHTQPKFPPKTRRFPTVGKKASEEKALKEMDSLITILQKTADSRAPGPIFHAEISFPIPSKDLHWYFSSPLCGSLSRMMGGCSMCGNFVNTYGSLCTVNDDGEVVPVIWPQDIQSVPFHYRHGVTSVLKLFSNCRVGDEYTLGSVKDRTLGHARGQNPQWRHLHLTLNGGPLTGGSKDGLNTKTSLAMLTRVLDDYDKTVIAQAQHLIYEKLPHGGPHRSVIDFLESVASRVEGIEDAVKRHNLVTKFSRVAWVGCLSSLRGGVVGQLLSDIKAGNSYSEIHGRWSSMANPLVYLRPTSAPSVGNISEAEKIFNNLGYSKDDLIRYAMTTNQVPASGILWADKNIWNLESASEPQKAGLFSSVVPKATTSTVEHETSKDPTAKEISFRSFAKRILPTAKSVDIYLEDQVRFAFMTTGAPGTQSPFSFGSATNTASWYYWSKPLPIAKANIRAGWNPVTSVISLPHMWEHLTATEGLDYEPSTAADGLSEGAAATEGVKAKWPFSRHGVRYMFCVKDAKEEQRMAASLFPTIMRGEFHCVRKTVEAFSNDEKVRQPLDGDRWGQVGGIAGGDHRWTEVLVRVTTEEGHKTEYRISLYG